MSVDLSLFSLEVSRLLSSCLQLSLHPQVVFSSNNLCSFSVGSCLGLPASIELTRLNLEVVLHSLDFSSLAIGGLSLSAHGKDSLKSKVVRVVHLGGPLASHVPLLLPTFKLALDLEVVVMPHP